MKTAAFTFTILIGKRGENSMILYHASKEIVEFPEVRKTRYTKYKLLYL